MYKYNLCSYIYISNTFFLRSWMLDWKSVNYQVTSKYSDYIISIILSLARSLSLSLILIGNVNACALSRCMSVEKRYDCVWNELNDLTLYIFIHISLHNERFLKPIYVYVYIQNIRSRHSQLIYFRHIVQA